MAEVRQLGPGDEAALEAFLLRHLESSVFLLSNLREAGFVDRGEALQGRYAAAFEDGHITAVAGHFWNGLVLLQAPAHVAALLAGCLTSLDRRVEGFIGPWQQVEAARQAYDAGGRGLQFHQREILQSLSLDALRVPERLAAGDWTCRPATPADLRLLGAWRAQYCVETIAASPGPALDTQSAREIKRLHDRQSVWLLESRGLPVAMASHNASLDDLVQIGGVFTPPEQRGRGYGRAVVAGALLAAQAAGKARAVLFTHDDNYPAQQAYAGLGFETIGDYGMALYQGAQL